MLFRKMVPALALFLFISPVRAQTPGTAQSTAKRPLRGAALMRQYMPVLQKRLDFVNKAYKLEMNRITGLLSTFSGMISEHANYMKEHESTLRLRTASLRIARTQKNVSQEILNRVIAKFENEIYEIHEKAPLSLTNLVKIVEKDMPAEQVAQGRSAIRERFAEALKDKPLMIDKLDRLAMGPISDTPAEPSVEDQQRILKERIKAEQLARTRQQHNNPVAKTPAQPPRPAPVNPNLKKATEPPKPVPPAPPIKDWPEVIETAAARYKFSEVQIKAAQRVLKSCITRGESHLNQKQADYDQIAKLTDADKKNKQLRILNKPLDKLYDELNQRVESIASIEQRQGLVKTASKKDAAPK